MMNLLRLIGGRTASAPVARERLQILLAHERGVRGQPDLLGVLRAEILAVVSRHIVLDPEKVTVKMDRGKHVSTLEVDIEVHPTVSRDQLRPRLDDRQQQQRHPLAGFLKSLALGLTPPVRQHTVPADVARSSSAPESGCARRS